MTEKRDFYIQLDGSTGKLTILIDKKELKITFSCSNQILPINYENSYKKSELIQLSNYFSKFNSINEIFRNISILISEEKYSLSKVNENSTNKIILNLIPDPIEDKYDDQLEITFNLPLLKISTESLVKNLYEIIANMSSQINSLNEKVKNLETDHVSQNQILNSNKNMEKLTNKLNKYNKLVLDLNNDNKFLERAKIVMSNNILIDGKNEKNLFKNWINKGNIKLSLIYKATVDSDFAGAFHYKCDDHSPTITIIRTDQELRFGGYTTKTWNCDNDCKEDNEAFLFSLNNKKKYNVKKGTECAIYCNKDYGPSFGEGFDLCLCDNYMGINGSYSHFPTSYGKGYKSNELTGGNFSFRVLDAEVYQVEFL